MPGEHLELQVKQEQLVTITSYLSSMLPFILPYLVHSVPISVCLEQIMPYCVRIARFMPRVEIVQRHNSTVRRLHIQGDNGKVEEQRNSFII